MNRNQTIGWLLASLMLALPGLSAALPGEQAAKQFCGICHSLIVNGTLVTSGGSWTANVTAPRDEAGWTRTINRMMNNDGAPVNASDVPAIAAYLAALSSGPAPAAAPAAGAPATAPASAATQALAPATTSLPTPTARAISGKVLVLVNAANKQSLSADDVQNIYNDHVTRWKNGNTIQVLNLPVDEPAREAFSRKILGTSAREAAAAESNRNITNTAKNPSKVKRERLVATMVAKDPDAIGYVSAETLDNKDGIRILMELK